MLIESNLQRCQLKTKSFYMKNYKCGILNIKRVNAGCFVVRARVTGNTYSIFFDLEVGMQLKNLVRITTAISFIVATLTPMCVFEGGSNKQTHVLAAEERY